MSVKALLCLFFALLCHSAIAKEWRYIDPTSLHGTQAIRISVEDQTVSFFSHTAYKWSDCGSEDSDLLVCFDSYPLVIRVPRVSGTEPVEWMMDGVPMTVRLHKDVRLFGRAVEDIIVVNRKDRDEGYMYSTLRGIISVFSTDNQKFGIGLLEGVCGFGASEECAE